jgi:hypothetical protein
MKEQTKLTYLKKILFVKVILTFFVWGLPCLFGTEKFLSLFDLAMPGDPIYLRLFGTVVIALGVAYWFAWRDPIRNRAILVVGIVDNGLVTLTIIYLALTSGITSWFISVSAVLTGFFFFSFILLLPKKQ